MFYTTRERGRALNIRRFIRIEQVGIINKLVNVQVEAEIEVEFFVLSSRVIRNYETEGFAYVKMSGFKLHTVSF